MPKYFSDEKPIPFDLISWQPADISIKNIEQVFELRNSASFSIRMPGLEADCLGYLVNATVSEGRFEIVDIVKKHLMTLQSSDELVRLLRHACGLQFDPHIQAELLKLRALLE